MKKIIFFFTFLLSFNFTYANETNTNKKWGSKNVELDGGVQYYLNKGYKLNKTYSLAPSTIVYILTKKNKIISCSQAPGLRETYCSIP